MSGTIVHILLILWLAFKIGLSAPTSYLGQVDENPNTLETNYKNNEAIEKRFLFKPLLRKSNLQLDLEKLDTATKFFELIEAFGKAVLVFPMLTGMGSGTFIDLLFG